MIRNRIYDITLWSYVVALSHFASEWLLFRSADLSSGLLGPMIVARMSLYPVVCRRADDYCSGVDFVDDKRTRLLCHKISSARDFR